MLALCSVAVNPHCREILDAVTRSHRAYSASIRPSRASQSGSSYMTGQPSAVSAKGRSLGSAFSARMPPAIRWMMYLLPAKSVDRSRARSACPLSWVSTSANRLSPGIHAHTVQRSLVGRDLLVESNQPYLADRMKIWSGASEWTYSKASRNQVLTYNSAAGADRLRLHFTHETNTTCLDLSTPTPPSARLCSQPTAASITDAQSRLQSLHRVTPLLRPWLGRGVLIAEEALLFHCL